MLVPFLFSVLTAQSPAAGDIRYTVRLAPSEARTELVVDVRWRPDSLDGRTVGLPRDLAYGFPVARHVVSLEGADGTRVDAGPDSVTRLVRPGPDGTAHLHYRLVFDVDDTGDATYAPSVGPRHAHAAAAQWMLAIGPATRPRPFVVGVEGPAGWSTYNTLGARTVGSRQGLARAMLGGTLAPAHRFVASGGVVRVFTPGGFALSTRSIDDLVERLVREQRRVFGAGDTTFDVVVLPRPHNVAGVATARGFVAFMRPDVTRPRLARLLAHETLHAWMTDAVFRIGPDSLGTENFLRSRWFIEGVDDFVARELLREGGVLDEATFVDFVNRDLIDLADNPDRRTTFAAMRAAADSGRFDVAYTKLNYHRGALMALGWSAALRARGRGLPALIATMHRRARARSTPMSWDEFLAQFTRAGLDARGDEAKYVWRGEAIVPHGDALGPRWRLRDSLVASFDPGFDLAASRAARRFVGVRAGGPAERAGARDGMPIVAMTNENRFSYAWDPDEPLMVEALDDGRPRRLAIDPRGAPRTLRLYGAAAR